MYKGSLAKYYDDIYHDKDYSAEAEFIENNSKLNKVLDIGCGTGTHIENLYKNDRVFVGVDPENEMLEMAKIKFANYSNVSFKNCDITKLYVINLHFDTIISMFNIVNHILNKDDLIKYFKKIGSLLAENGTFIFDCFNGDAVFSDGPKDVSKEIKSRIEGGSYIVTYKPSFNSDTGDMVIDHNVKVIHSKYQEVIESFDYTLEHKIWLQNDLKPLIEGSDMRVEKVVSSSDYDKEADISDYKITFVCKGVTR